MKTVKVKLYNSDSTCSLMQTIDIAGIIYNTALTIIDEVYRDTGLMLDKFNLQKSLKELRNIEDNSHWKMVNSQTVQDITDRIYRAYKLFLTNKKKGIKCSKPKRKKVKKYTSITFKQCGCSFLNGNRIKIGKHIYRYFDSYNGCLAGMKAKTITVKRNKLEEIFVYAVLDESFTMGESREGRIAVGIDFGLKTFLTLSDGTKIESPQFFKSYIKKIRKASRELSSKEKGSGNWHRALLNLERRHIDIVNRRRDFFFKVARELCSKYNIICLEDLNIKGMQKIWGRKVSDYAFSEFIQILEWMAKKLCTQIVFIDRYYPSSKTCIKCGNIKEDLSLKDRVYVCDKCGNTIDRDYQASLSILKEGLKLIGKEESEVS